MSASQLDNTIVCSWFLEDYKSETLYKNAYRASQKNQWMRLSGLPIALVSALATVIGRVASVAEVVLKSLSNLFGALLFARNCHLEQGLKQLCIDLPINLWRLALTPIEVIAGIFITTFAILINPVEYCKFRGQKHLSEAKKLQAFMEYEEEKFDKYKFFLQHYNHYPSYHFPPPPPYPHLYPNPYAHTGLPPAPYYV